MNGVLGGALGGEVDKCGVPLHFVLCGQLLFLVGIDIRQDRLLLQRDTWQCVRGQQGPAEVISKSY